MEQLRLVGVSFHCAGKIFDFDAQDFDLPPGTRVVVETERGRALGTVVTAPQQTPSNNAPPKMKAVMRIASEDDLRQAAVNGEKEKEALSFCRQRAAQRGLDMKLVRAEYLFDGSKVLFYFTADGRVDFRDLVRDLAQHLRTRIEMRQIGVRDEAKLVGGLGICGRELCCSSYLRDFAPVSVKMAKAQGLALNPTKISGQCGRLLCCLAYEYETYSDLRKNLPKIGKKVTLPDGPAEVISVDILGQSVILSCQGGERCRMHIDALNKDLNAPRQPEKPANEPAGAVIPPSATTEQTAESSRPAQQKRRSGGRRGNQENAPAEEQPRSAPPEPLAQQAGTDEQDKPARKRKKRPRRRGGKAKKPGNQPTETT